MICQVGELLSCNDAVTIRLPVRGFAARKFFLGISQQKMVKGNTECRPGQCYDKVSTVQVPVELYHPVAILSILNVLIVLFVRLRFDFVFFDTNTVQSYNTHLSVGDHWVLCDLAFAIGLSRKECHLRHSSCPSLATVVGKPCRTLKEFNNAIQRRSALEAADWGHARV